MDMSPMLQAREAPWARAAREDDELLDAITHAVGGPFHLIYPDRFADNLGAFQAVLCAHGVTGRVYFGKKANKAGAWLSEVARLGGAVDVASVPELVHCLAHGIRGEDIGVTGAAKSDELLWLAARHGCTVAIDALDELERAVAIATGERPMAVLLRVLPAGSPHSRFGLNDGDLETALQRCATSRQAIEMRGFSFHLDGYQVEPRAELAGVLVDRCLEARERGFPARAISIGGGFACAYLDEEDWRSFLEGLDVRQFHADRRFERFYPYFQTPTGASMLEAILRNRSAGRSLATRLSESDVSLYLEPGRALLDGAGMSIFPVQGFKRNDAHGIVTVAGLSMSLSEQWKGSEYLPTPILVQRGPPREQRPVQAAVGGSSCMEYDVLTWRKVSFPATPRHGDLVVYANTAGYQMDKNESEFHQLPLPPKIVLTRRDGRFLWRRDER